MNNEALLTTISTLTTILACAQEDLNTAQEKHKKETVILRNAYEDARRNEDRVLAQLTSMRQDATSVEGKLCRVEDAYGVLVSLFANTERLDALTVYMANDATDEYNRPHHGDRGWDKIAVIKRVREITGWGLYESKQFVDAYPFKVRGDTIIPSAFTTDVLGAMAEYAGNEGT